MTAVIQGHGRWRRNPTCPATGFVLWGWVPGCHDLKWSKISWFSHDFLYAWGSILYVYKSEVKNGQPQKENLRMVQILSLKMVMTWGWWLWHWVYWAYHIKWWCCWGWLGKARNRWESPWLAIYFERATRSEADQRERNLPFFFVWSRLMGFCRMQLKNATCYYLIEDVASRGKQSDKQPGFPTFPGTARESPEFRSWGHRSGASQCSPAFSPHLRCATCRCYVTAWFAQIQWDFHISKESTWNQITLW